ncbi:hypothetical protein MMC27_007594 [Xylographa pallens]|nr:hypothetical protein [Xylographa pallens]
MNFDVDADINDDDAVEDIDRVLTHLRHVVSSVERQLRGPLAGLLPYFKNGVASLPFLVNEPGDAYSQEEASSKDKKLDWQNSAPHIDCSDELPWAAFPEIIANALRLGAKEAGGFLGTLEPSTPGYSWKGCDEAIDCQKSRLMYIPESPGNGAYRLNIDATENFKFPLNEIKSWPAHPVEPLFVALQFDRFDSQLLSARNRREAYVAPPYAINKDADTQAEREILGLNSISPLVDIEGNQLANTKVAFKGIHSPEAFVSTSHWGSPFGVHVEDFYLHAINHNVCGALKLWCLIPEEYAVPFENLMLKINKRSRECDQFVRHDYTWPTRDVPERARIRYTLIYQQEHQAVVTLSHVYHWGFSIGANIAEAINYADDDFNTEGYTACHKGCGTAAKSFITADGLSMLESTPESAADNSTTKNVPPDPACDPRESRKRHAESSSNLKGKGNASASGKQSKKRRGGGGIAKGLKDHGSGKNKDKGKPPASTLRQTTEDSDTLLNQVANTWNKEFENSSFGGHQLNEDQGNEIIACVCGIGSSQLFAQLQDTLRQYRSTKRSRPEPPVEDENPDQVLAREYLKYMKHEDSVTYSKLQLRFKLVDLYREAGRIFDVHTPVTMAKGARDSRTNDWGALAGAIVTRGGLGITEEQLPAFARRLRAQKVLASRLDDLTREYGLGFLILIPVSSLEESPLSNNKLMKWNKVQFSAFQQVLRFTRVDWVTDVCELLLLIGEDMYVEDELTILALTLETMEYNSIVNLSDNSKELLDILRPVEVE